MPFTCCDLPIFGVPMFRMPPSFRGVSSVAFGAVCFAGPASKGTPCALPPGYTPIPGLWGGFTRGAVLVGYRERCGSPSPRPESNRRPLYQIRVSLSPLSYKGIGGPEAEVNLRAEGKRSGSAEIRPHTPIVTYATLVFPLARGIFNFFYETMKDL